MYVSQIEQGFHKGVIDILTRSNRVFGLFFFYESDPSSSKKATALVKLFDPIVDTVFNVEIIDNE